MRISDWSADVCSSDLGFTSMLIKLLGDERPDGVAVCFDRGRPAFRHDRYEDYKANRREQPDTLREQFGLIHEVLGTMRIPTVSLEIGRASGREGGCTYV